MPPKKAQTTAAKKAAISSKATATKKANVATATPSTAVVKGVNGTKRASSRATKPTSTAAPAKKADKPNAATSTTVPKAKPVRKPAAAKKTVAPAKPAKKAVAPKPVIGKRKAAEDLEDAPKAKKVKVTKAAEAPRKIAMPRGRPANNAEVDAAKTKKPAAKKAPIPKKAATPKEPAAPKSPKKVKPLPDINTVPTQVLDIYVFGEGSAGELGLGAKSADGKKVVDVTRPRLNPRLAASSVGVVQIAVGGMHCAALTKDNKILTWGVNDQGALGRTTAQEGKMKDIGDGDDSDSDSDDDDSGLNPSEAEPREVDMTHFEEGTKIASLYAGDSSTYAVTTTGQVYGWGTFRGNDGILGFRQGINTQWAPMLIPELKNIVKLAIGTNHVLALDNKGKVFAWGAGEQNQLGRRVVSRTATGALTPREFGLQRKKIVDIGCGDYHNFAVQDNGNVHAWGLNTFGQTGVEKKGEDDDTVLTPTVVKVFKDYDIKQITGGAHHSIACTKDGKVLTIGKADTNQSGVKFEDIPKEYLYVDEQGRPRYLSKPLVVPNIKGIYVATATDTSLVVDADGKAHSWGFSGNYQTGQGSDDDVRQATWIDNTAVRGKKLVVAGVGGQFGVLGGLAGDSVAA